MIAIARAQKAMKSVLIIVASPSEYCCRPKGSKLWALLIVSAFL
jgi:hypothetical protein